MIRTVLPGDTIISVAVREYGDAARWTDIVAANRLDAPYIASDPTQFPHLNVFGPGDSIVIPIDMPAVPLDDALDRTYGRDLAWSDITFDLTREAAHFTLDRGQENLRKALLRRLITRPGELPAHPEYGCWAYLHVGQTATDWRVRLIELEVETALLQDPRVQSLSATAEYDPRGAVFVTVAVTPIPPLDPFGFTTGIGAPHG